MNKYAQRVQELEGRPAYQNGQPLTLSENDLQEIERQLGHPLPSDYREFLRDFGGYDFFVICPIRSGRLEKLPYDYRMARAASLGTFYGLKLSYPSNLLLKYQDDVAGLVLGPELLPIARDAAGNQVCLFLAGPQQGKVYFWLSERAKSPYDYSNLYLITDSFDEFMHSLRLEGDEVEDE